ncbi:MAG: Asp-tRNA(Asn)/Glu-tRNA(Gln) amidotransferase subunit GatA [Acidobacteriota bacterium]
MKNICEMPVRTLKSTLLKREVSVRETASFFLDRVEEKDHVIKAFLTLDRDRILSDADRIDMEIKNGKLSEKSALPGIPVALKDNIISRGTRTTCGSKILGNYIPPYDATVVSSLRQEGALIFGKCNCDEFAMGSSTENSAFHPTRNPADTERVPGGSSGGSAAAVAAGFVPLSLGSDTGGSIRQPAAFCGVTGLKPTYGLVSRYGLVAFGSSLDQIGPFGNSTEDAALLLNAISGYDPHDSTSARRPAEDFTAQLNKDISGTKIGICPAWFSSGLDPEISESVKNSLAKLEGLGCTIVEINLPHSEYAIETYYIIAPAEASSNLARFDGVKYGFRSSDHTDLETMYRNTRTQGFGDEVKRRIMIGTYVLSSGYYDAYFLKASKVRNLIKQDYLEAFKKIDFIAGPTTPTPPFRLGEKTTNPLEMYLSDIYTVGANLAGIPALSMPCGKTGTGLPVGIQLQGPHFSEAGMLSVASALEAELDGA